jgi:hypothetical protein
VHALRVRMAAPRLDARIAAGEELSADPHLAHRATQLVSMRSRRRVAAGLERVWRSRCERPVLSAAIPFDRYAVSVARPMLAQLAVALRTRAWVHPRGVAITQLLLTEPSSALYWPAHPDHLYEVAREALFALGTDEAPVARAPRRSSPHFRRDARARRARARI